MSKEIEGANFKALSIKNNIIDTHKKFKAKYNVLIDKVSSDHYLQMTRIAARLNWILNAMKEARVISRYVRSEEKYCINYSVFAGKFGSIGISTNGKRIMVRNDDILEPETKNYYNVHHDSFDWQVFAEQLLDFIHSHAYFRKELSDSMIYSLLSK